MESNHDAGQPTAAFLFAGGGGCTQGAIAAGYSPVWAVEYDKHAAAIYHRRFPQAQLIQADITGLSDEFVQSLPIPDIIVWGSPCPDFSTAGNRAGFTGDRGKLFFEGIRFLRLLQPSYFLFENVEGIITHDSGETFKQVIASFGQVGYMGTWQLRNGNRHVPQNRKRIFCVGVHWRCAKSCSTAWEKVAQRMLTE